MNIPQRRTLVIPEEHIACTAVPKGTSLAEVTLNSEKIKPVALAIVELCLTEGIRQ